MSAQAFILLNCVLGKESELLEELKSHDEVIEGYIVMGSFDLIIKVDARSKKESLRIKRKLENDGLKKKVDYHGCSGTFITKKKKRT